MEQDNKDIELKSQSLIEPQDEKINALQRKGTLTVKSYTNAWQRANSLIKQKSFKKQKTANMA